MYICSGPIGRARPILRPHSSTSGPATLHPEMKPAPRIHLSKMAPQISSPPHRTRSLRALPHRSRLCTPIRAIAASAGGALPNPAGNSGDQRPHDSPAAAPAGPPPLSASRSAPSGPGVTSVRQAAATSTRESPLRSWLARIAQLLQYRLMVLFRLPTWGKMLALVAVGLPIMLLGTSALLLVTDLSWQEAMQYAFYVLQNVPGADITGFPELSARVVLILIHLLSLYTFATMVGLLTEDVRTTVEEIRCGNFPIPARDHTVILDPSGDPTRLLHTLTQVLAARAASGGSVYPGSIAVLSQHPKDELDRRIADLVPQEVGNVVTRYGSPIKVSDLERVAAAHARTMLLLAPDGPMGHHLSPGLQQQLCLTALRALQPKAAAGRQRVIVENNSAALMATGIQRGRATGSGGTTEGVYDDPLHVTYVSSTSSASRVAVQCAVQPGLAAVFDAVFCRSDDAALRLVRLPQQLAGRPFAEARRMYDRAVVCGILSGTHQAQPGSPPASPPSSSSSLSAAANTPPGLRFSPPDDELLLPGDRLVVLASSEADCQPLSAPAEAPPLPGLTSRYDARRAMPKNIVLLAADSALAPAMTAALREFAAPGCNVTVVSPEPVSGMPASGLPESLLAAALAFTQGPGGSGTGAGLNLRFHNEVGELMSPATLLKADVVAADAVILTGTDGLPPDEADALAVGTALLLQRLLADPLITSSSFPSSSSPSSSSSSSPGPAPSAASSSAPTPATDGNPNPNPSTSPDPNLSTSTSTFSAAINLTVSATTALDGDNEGPTAADTLVRSLLQSMPAAPSSDDFWTGSAPLSSLSSVSSVSSASSLASMDFAETLWVGSRRLPSRPLTYVCSLRDSQNRTVLQHIAEEAHRAAAGATPTAGGVAGGGGGGGGAAGTGGSRSSGSGGGDGGGGGGGCRGLSVEVVEPEVLISGMLAQVGAEPLLVSALEDLLDEQGCEVYIKRCERYGLPRGQQLAWAQVSEVVRARGDVALGCLTRRGRLHLAPPADSLLELQSGDKVVVLSESFL